MMHLLVNLTGLLLIGATVWWFWLGPTKTAAAVPPSASKLEILVKDGVYQPDQILLPAGQPTELIFRREDPNPCAEHVLFPDLEISAQLASDTSTSLQLPALKAGEYPFHCQMQMYRGRLLVE
ncbi:cupredoxin domain-containing protein [Microbulbifer sp. TYP-18]|uniref:cupredoxin domain-containing protein n=1 Tax=Microbulbifer sp. TYP-18 TaxID=3230024 RepID=UPI0034C681ED